MNARRIVPFIVMTTAALLVAAAPPAESPAAPGGSAPASPARPAAPGPTPPAAPAPPAAPPTTPGPAAPKNVSVTDVVLKDLDGKDVPLRQYKGKPMVIEIWATWCGPCNKQRELMKKLAPEFKDTVTFLAASCDTGGPTVVKQHLAKHPSVPELKDAMQNLELDSLIRQLTSDNTIPKVIYVNSKGVMLEVSSTVQTESWMRARLKSLR